MDLGPELTRLMEQHLPVEMKPKYRRAICIKCSRPIETMWHCWHDDGGYLKEQHLCRDCGADYGLVPPKTLVVVAAVDHTFDENVEELQERAERHGHGFLRVDTSGGGYPTWAYIRTFLERPDYESYLFLQDSMRPVDDRDYVVPFATRGTDVVAWARFNLFFDNEEQMQWCVLQYQENWDPPAKGIFGPVFYATGEALRKATPFFPRYPQNRNQYQGSERAWAFAFKQAEVSVADLGAWETAGLERGDTLGPFRKTFAIRP